jgi:zinc D-Ala-D-Ala dipeptidase
MKRIILLLFFFLYIPFFSAQGIKINEYGLPLVNDTLTYKYLVSENSDKLLVDLSDYIPGIILDIRYASKNNFYGEAVYEEAYAFLRKPAADALKFVQEELRTLNKTLKIFDAYRPYSVTLLFYEKIKDTNFVASAWTGSRHNRGCAVDLTIADIFSGEDLKMPTTYDDFTEKAAIDYEEADVEKRNNRELLQSLMIKYGFIPLKSEWWHFDFSGWKNYELTDISFIELKAVSDTQLRKDLQENAR